MIDGALNCCDSLVQATDAELERLFPDRTDVAFQTEVWSRLGAELAQTIFNAPWTRPIANHLAMGIHGPLFHGLEQKKQFYPTRLEREMSPGSLPPDHRTPPSRVHAPRERTSSKATLVVLSAIIDAIADGDGAIEREIGRSSFQRSGRAPASAHWIPRP